MSTKECSYKVYLQKWNSYWLNIYEKPLLQEDWLTWRLIFVRSKKMHLGAYIYILQRAVFTDWLFQTYLEIKFPHILSWVKIFGLNIQYQNIIETINLWKFNFKNNFSVKDCLSCYLKKTCDNIFWKPWKLHLLY